MTTSSRVFKFKEQIISIYYGAKGFVLLRFSKKTKLMNKQLKERIMLAITEVNGCEMCSFIHTKLALSSGMSRENIKKILDGDTTSIPIDDAVAVMFGQDYAYSKECPSAESIKRIIDEYGYQKAELIVAASNMITMTNGMGTSMDYFYRRLKFKRNRNSNILIELFNPLFTMLLFPLFVLFFSIKTLLGSKPKTLNTVCST